MNLPLPAQRRFDVSPDGAVSAETEMTVAGRAPVPFRYA